MPLVNIYELEPCGLCKNPAEYSDMDQPNGSGLNLVQCSNGRCGNASWGTREWNRNQHRIEKLRRLYLSLATQMVNMEQTISEAPRKYPLFVTSTISGTNPGPCPLCNSDEDCEHRIWIDRKESEGI